MKRKLLIIVIFLMLCSSAFSQPKKLQAELRRTQNKIFDCPHLNSNFSFVSMFYTDVCFNRNLINLVDKETLREICKCVYQHISDGYLCFITVYDYSNNQNMDIIFKYIEETNLLVITSNYDAENERIIPYEENQDNTWALGYYIENGDLVYYEYKNKPRSAPEEKLQRQLAALEGNEDPLLYIEITETYYEMNKIEEGMKFLKNNKSKALKLSPKGNLKDIIATVEEEGEVLLELNQ